jgi:hypothetical protein
MDQRVESARPFNRNNRHERNGKQLSNQPDSKVPDHITGTRPQCQTPQHAASVAKPKNSTDRNSIKFND